MMHKFVNGKAPDYLNDLFKHVNNILYVQDKVKLAIFIHLKVQYYVKLPFNTTVVWYRKSYL